MNIYAFSTGAVCISHNWRVGTPRRRLLNTLLDNRMTDWLPINCYLIEHPAGLILIDTGIPTDANRRVYFPPYMPLVQRVAKFSITAAQEIGPLMQAAGFDPAAVRYVILTHLHQDHDGGLHQFPQAEVIVARTEWQAASGLSGRMAGYLNQRWPQALAPTLINFEDGPYAAFDAHTRLFDDLVLLPTPGHSPGHMAVVLEQDAARLCFAGDLAYTEDLLLADAVDGIGPDPALQRDSHRRILSLADAGPLVFLPTHDPAAAERLATWQPLPAPDTIMPVV